MEEEYYSYIKNWFKKWSVIYDVVTMPFSGVRDKVVDFAGLSNGSRILDVATGTGGQAFAFAKKGYDVIGIDFSEDMLNIAKKKNKYKNVKLQIADATHIPFENKYFDASIVSLALHEMPLNIREKVLSEMVRVTKPEGTIIVIDYALPNNKIGRFMVYHFVKLYESKYYPEFIKFDFEPLLKKLKVELKSECSVFLGAVRILKGIKNGL